MISEVDLNDWDSIDTEKVRENLDNIVYRYTTDQINIMKDIIKFVDQVELIRRKYVRQVPVLLKQKKEVND